MLNRAPSDCHHTATAFPDASTATCGLKAGPALSVSMRVAVPQPTPGTYRFAQMLNWTPSSAFHTATALPDGSAATWGDCASPASVSMRVAVPQPTPATYRFAKTLYRAPSHVYHTATALPAAWPG